MFEMCVCVCGRVGSVVFHGTNGALSFVIAVSKLTAHIVVLQLSGFDFSGSSYYTLTVVACGFLEIPHLTAHKEI